MMSSLTARQGISLAPLPRASEHQIETAPPPLQKSSKTDPGAGTAVGRIRSRGIEPEPEPRIGGAKVCT